MPRKAATACLGLFLSLMLSPSGVAQETVLYVSTAGDDAWSGRLAQPNATLTDGPFATLTQARDALRELRKQGPLGGPATIRIRGGTYSLTEPLVLEPEDSGTPQAPVSYEASPQEEAVLSGGRRISGWKPVAMAEDSRIRQAGAWMAEVPKVEDGSLYPHQLFVDGQRRTRARTPNQGFFHVDGRISFERRSRFRYREGDIRSEWAGQGDVEVVALCKWQQYRIPITAVDPAGRSVTLAGSRMLNGADPNPRYWVENTADALDAPGEWYLDRQAGALYYTPMPGEDVNKCEVVASFLPRLVEFAGDAASGRYVHDVILRGLSFQYADWRLGPQGYSGISVGWTWGWGRTAAHDNIIEQNHIHRIGRGLLSDMGCIYTLGAQPGTVLRNNLCHDVTRYDGPQGYGAWGLYLDSASSQILVENNIVYRAYDGAYHNQYGQENTVRNNIFALGTRSQLTRHYRGAKRPSFYLERNIIYWKEGGLLWGAWDDGRYQLDHNLYFRADGQPVQFGTSPGPGSGKSAWTFSLEEWQEKRGQDKHSMVADPLFSDPEHGDFSLKPDSPALGLGFQPIDVSRVGPRKPAGFTGSQTSRAPGDRS
jgi:hypothetical protein